MKTYTISQLARQFGLSRSTLLYYDRIGLLRAGTRSAAGYRLYGEAEVRRLERIRDLRRAGLSVESTARILASDSEPSAQMLEKRLKALGEEILALQNQQRLIAAMLQNITNGAQSPVVDKKLWVQMLESAGMDEAAMRAWHVAFETRAPEAHYRFLRSLGIEEAEARAIQGWSRATDPPDTGG